MKVTRRGQVTIPKEIRQQTGIDEGTNVEFKEENGRIIIVKAACANPFEAWTGYLHKSGKKSDELVRGMRGHRANRG